MAFDARFSANFDPNRPFSKGIFANCAEILCVPAPDSLFNFRAEMAENGYFSKENGQFSTENGRFSTENGQFLPENGQNRQNLAENAENLAENGQNFSHSGQNFSNSAQKSAKNAEKKPFFGPFSQRIAFSPINYAVLGGQELNPAEIEIALISHDPRHG
jgi:hypothetical protein